jgi:hypothetical protein
LNIPLAKNILITGGVNDHISSCGCCWIIESGQQTHIMYNAGIKVSFGGKKTNPDEVYNAKLNEQLDIKDKET